MLAFLGGLHLLWTPQGRLQHSEYQQQNQQNLQCFPMHSDFRETDGCCCNAYSPSLACYPALVASKYHLHFQILAFFPLVEQVVADEAQMEQKQESFPQGNFYDHLQIPVIEQKNFLSSVKLGILTDTLYFRINSWMSPQNNSKF